VTCTCDFCPIANGAWVQLQLYRDSTPIGNILQVEPGPTSGANANIPFTLTFIDTPVAGTYTYSARGVGASFVGSTFNFGEAGGPVMTAIELASAVGPTGAAGPTGPTGPTGPAGLTTGSWTLSPGDNTVSFTVPDNNTYVMWVRGNIPNGIVVWNATVTITNPNVPAIGTQYGWYYTGGNALVLTEIPNHIVGADGGISTSLPVITTANVFTFKITNNSGSSQRVDYGYLKL
jgi:hypothetical protein